MSSTLPPGIIIPEAPKLIMDVTTYGYVTLTQRCTGMLEGDFFDWPAQIQDQILTKLEKTNKRDKTNYEIVSARCEPDPDDQLEPVPKGICLVTIVARSPNLSS